MRADMLEGLSGRVGRQLVIAGDDPGLALVFNSNLSRPEHMAGRVKRNANAIDVHGFAVSGGFDMGFVTEPCPVKMFAGTGDEIALVSAIRVVGMGVSDNGTVNRLPRVNVKPARFAIEPLRSQPDQPLACHTSILL